MTKFALNVCAYVVGLPLQALIIVAMLRGSYRRLPLVFAYMVFLFIATLAETPLYVATYGFRMTNGVSLYVKLYWTNERILLALVFLSVISLIYQAVEKTHSRRVIHVGIVAGAILFAAITFWVYYDKNLGPGEWMTPWTSSLNFGAAILDLALWTMLIAARAKDHRLLLLSGGLGIQFTGQAIGEAIRNLAQRNRSSSISFAGGVLMIITNLMFLYIWYQALRSNQRTRQVATGG